MDPKFRSLPLGLALAGILLSNAAAAVNDHFADRTAITGTSATVTASSAAATGETGEPDHAANAGARASVWWSWTAPLTGTVSLSTAGSDFDTVLGVYTGAAVDALTEVASNDNAAGGAQSGVAWACTAGTEYIVAVDGAGAAEGNVSLTLSAGVPEIVVEQGGVGLTNGTATVVFGTVAAPGFAGRSFTVRNTGTGPLLGVAASVSGAGYSVTVQPAGVIAGGGFSTMTVRFAPTVNGGHPGTLTVASSDADENPFNVGLSGSGLANVIGFYETFDPALTAALWAAPEAGAVFGTVDTIAQAAGAGSTGNSLRFDGNGVRQAATVAVNALAGGSVAFSFASGNGAVSGWETADGGEEVVLEYSLDGAAWTQFGGPYQSAAWQSHLVAIPPAARTGATRFRWRQLSHSGGSLDNWALDDIRIGPPTAVPVISNSLTVRAFTGHPFFFQINASNSPDTYSAAGLPVGLGVNAATGLISGTASVAGTYTVTLGATNVVGPATATLTLTVQVPVPAEDFKILSLGTGGANVVDHNAFTGDDHGGIAVSGSHVFVTGDNASARYELGTLTGGAGLALVDGFCSDLSTGALYTLGLNGVAYTPSVGSVNQLLVLHPATGLATGQVITLSAAIPLSNGAVFSGAGRVVVHNRTAVYDILLPTGQVVNRGAMPAPPWYSSESWGVWGVAEQFGGALWLAYRDTNSQDIRRMRVPDGQVQTIASFTNLGDMASWTVSPQTGRWYFHYESSGQFGGSGETLGTALATFDIGNPTTPPDITSPLTATAYTGASARYQITALRFPTAFGATGLPPGLTVDSGTGLISGMLSDADAGSYTVTISATNASGTSTAALVLTVQSALTAFFDDFDPAREDSLWDSFGGAVTVDTVGQATGPGSTDNSMRFNGATARFAVTKPIDTRSGGSVTFLLAPGNGFTSGWESPSTFSWMSVDYSTDGGLTWATLATPALIYEWKEVIIPLIPASKTGATQFRWMQAFHNGTGNDNWAIDDVRIGPPTEAPVITSELSATAYDQLPFTYRIIAKNVPDTYAAEDLPDWLTLNTVTGILSGTPPETGTYEIPLSATNIIGTGTALLTVNVYSTLSDFYDAFDPDVDDGIWQAFGGTPVADMVGTAAGPGSVGNSLRFNGTGVRFATTNPINTTEGGMIAFNFASGNGTTTGWDAPESSDGVVLEYSVDGVNFIQIGGPYLSTAWQTVSLAIPVAAQAGAVQFRWRQLFNSGAFNDNWALDDVIVGQPSAPPVITSAAGTAGYTGVPLSFVLTATNVPTLFTAAGLPAGLTLNGATGLISGTPSAAGSFAVTVGAENSFGEVSGTLTITIGALELPEDFKVLTLTTTNPLVVDHDALTSDDRGGVAVSASRVFVTGDGATASYTRSGLTGGASAGRIIDGIFSDVATGDLYTFAYNGTAFLSGNSIINQIIPLDGTTGAVAGAPIPLTQSIPAQFNCGVFSGVGRVVLHNGIRVFDIFLPSGLVVDRGAMVQPGWTGSESWASWGVAEYFEGNLWLAFCNGGAIVRQRVPDGLQETIRTFSGLGDTASWTVSPEEGRWYLHYESGSLFSGGSETLASARATFNIGAPRTPPGITSALALTAFTDKPLSYRITATRFPTLFGATGLPPGVTVNTATGVLSGTVTEEGTWLVTLAATNAAGTSTATLMLSVRTALTGFSDDFDPARDPLMWSAFGGTATTDTIGRASGAGSTGNSLRFDGSGTRFALTNPVDTRSGGSVVFRFAAGNDAASTTGWDTLDTAAEHVVLEYTLNGTTYTQIGGPYSNTTWQTVSVPIPAAARAPAVRFRWRQLSHSADNSSDNWAIEDVRIGPPAAPPVITSSSAVTAYIGLPFNWPVTATNFPDTFSASGLPSWLTIDAATGLLSGTPNSTDAVQITVSATNLLGTATAAVIVTISPSLPSVALFSDSAYVDMAATGEVANMRAALQNLGYTVNAFTGTTDAEWAAAFASNGVVIVPDLEVATPALGAAALAVVQTELAAGKGLIVAGSFSSSDEIFLNAVGGWNLVPGSTTGASSLAKAPAVTEFPNSPATLTPLDGTYLVSSASLPAGAQPVYTTGSETAVFYAGRIGFAAHDWYPGDDAAWRSVLGDLITVLMPPPLPGIVSASSVSTVAGAPFSYQVIASNSPLSYGALNLPSGLSINTATGVISGTVLSPAIYIIDLSATNVIGTANGTLSLTVTAPAPKLVVSGPDGARLQDGASTVNWTGLPGGQFTKTLRIQNTGSLPLTGLSAGITGTNGTFTSFALTTPPPASLAPGAGADVSITWTPGAVGPHSGWIYFLSNDAAGSFEVVLTGSPGAELPAPLPAQTGVFTGFTRGYWFTAPAAFEITGLRVPTDASAAAQSVAVVRLAAAPPTYASTTTGFTLLHLTRASAASGIIPVSIQVAAGDIIGVLGDRGGVASYAPSGSVTTINGLPVTLRRMGMQGHLGSTDPAALWGENTGSLSRVEMYYRASYTTDLDVRVTGAAPLSSGNAVTLPGAVSGGYTETEFTIQNTGGADLTGLTPALSGPQAGEFTIVSPPAALVPSGGTTTVVVRYSPVSAAATAQLSIVSNDPDENPFLITLHATLSTAGSGFSDWAAAAGLTGPDAQAGAAPYADGVSNLVKYAFNLNPAAPDTRQLPPTGGTAGLPRLTLAGPPGAPVLRAEFLRRTSGDVLYTPQRSTTTAPGSWVPFTSLPAITPAAPGWERVLYEEPIPPASALRTFGRIEVTLQ